MNYEIRAKVGTYKDKQTGEEKASYKTIGRTIETKNGPMIKLDVVPLNWDGWGYLSEPQERQQKPAQRPSHDAARARDTGRASPSGFDDMESDIPF